jgi:hypothetical protein
MTPVSETIKKIAVRAVALMPAPECGNSDNIGPLFCHLLDCAGAMEIDWSGMLAGKDYNLAHDVFGIARHWSLIDQRMGDHFLPRYARER